MIRKKQINKCPSRVRYEQTNPVISFRLPQETHAELLTQIKVLGGSFAAWVKEHMRQDNERASARAECLARERDGLGHDIKMKLQVLAKLSRLAEEHKRVISAPIEARQAEMLKEVEAERQVQLKALSNELLLTQFSSEKELTRLNQEIEVKKAESHQLGSTILAKRKDLGLLDQALANRQLLVEQLVNQAMEIARSKGVPAVACQSCPGYLYVSSMFSFIADMSSKIESSKKPPVVPGSTTQTVPKQGDGNG